MILKKVLLLIKSNFYTVKKLLKIIRSNSDFKTQILNYVNSKSEYFGDGELNSIPETDGVYIAFDKKKATYVYVGRSKNLKKGIAQQLKHSSKSSTLKKYYLKRYPELENEINGYFLKNIAFKYFESGNHVERCHIKYLLTALFEIQFVEKEH